MHRSGPLIAATIGISRSTSGCTTRRLSVMVRSPPAGLVMSHRLFPLMLVMNAPRCQSAPAPGCPRSSPISYSARGKSMCICPLKAAGPPSMWNIKVSTHEGVRLSARFLNAVKYAGSVIDMRSTALGGRTTNGTPSLAAPRTPHIVKTGNSAWLRPGWHSLASGFRPWLPAAGLFYEECLWPRRIWLAEGPVRTRAGGAFRVKANPELRPRVA